VTFPAIDQDQPTAQQIHAALKSAILSMSLPPGTRVSEAETGARFGASRTPVREAMTFLRDEGLIETIPSRGNFVTFLSEERHPQRAVHPRGAGSRRGDPHLRHRPRAGGRRALSVAITAQRNAISFDDPVAFYAADDAFHAALAGAAGLPRVRTLVIREKTALDRLRALRMDDMDYLRELEDEHKRHPQLPAQGQKLDRAQRVHARHLSRALDAMEELKASTARISNDPHPAFPR
jgi:DNA-binding GntR family transcriptional regulator